MAQIKLKKGANDAVRKQIALLQKAKLHVGWFDTAKYENGTPVAYIATIQEFGYPDGGIPARQFMRPTVENNKAAWQQTLAKGAKMVVNGKLKYPQMLQSFGMNVAGEISAAISAVTEPALSDSTIAARDRKRKSPGVSTKPLVDTGLMIQSVAAKVENV